MKRNWLFVATFIFFGAISGNAAAHHERKDTVIVLGYLGDSIVPQSHWHFLTAIDFDEGAATGHELQYVGLRFLDTATLGEQALEAVKNALAQPADQSSTASVTATTPATGNLQVFRDMSDLDWPEVSITLVAGILSRSLPVARYAE